MINLGVLNLPLTRFINLTKVALSWINKLTHLPRGLSIVPPLRIEINSTARGLSCKAKVILILGYYNLPAVFIVEVGI